MSQICFMTGLYNQLQCTKALYYDVYQFYNVNDLASLMSLSSVNIAVTYVCTALLCSVDKLLRQMVVQIYLACTHLDDHVEFLTLYQ